MRWLVQQVEGACGVPVMRLGSDNSGSVADKICKVWSVRFDRPIKAQKTVNFYAERP